MIDLHCHLDLFSNPSDIVARCVTLRLYVLSVTTVPSAFEGTAALAPARGRIRTALGLHPELAARRAHELPVFERLLPQTRYVGEIGLDGSRDHRGSLDVQRSVLQTILQLCRRESGRVLSIHSRGATGAILDELALEDGAGQFVLHWYMGTARQIARAVEMGCWFSVGPAMLATRAGIAAVAAMPPERVVPESDGPFGTVDGMPAHPWDAWGIVATLAASWRIPPREVEERLMFAFKNLLGHDMRLGGAAST